VVSYILLVTQDLQIEATLPRQCQVLFFTQLSVGFSFLLLRIAKALTDY